MRERIIITGGTGFVGSALTRHLYAAGYDVVVVARNAAKVIDMFEGKVSAASWNGMGFTNWEHFIDGALAVINLAGENIGGGRWTSTRKQRILDSRVLAGQTVAEAVAKVARKPKVVIQASAVGYYGNTGARPVDESEPSGEGFLAKVCRHWEHSSQSVEDLGVRRVIIRSGLVLGQGGILPKMAKPFLYYLGGAPGGGEQMISWVHLEDEVRAIQFLLENEQAVGAFNITAPNAVRMKTFYAELGRMLGKPSWLNVPKGLLRAALGEMADELVLVSQNVVPGKLTELGFNFHFPDVTAALTEILGQR
jgi:uncharacterized protein (TIGR01777 family)